MGVSGPDGHHSAPGTTSPQAPAAAGTLDRMTTIRLAWVTTARSGLSGTVTFTPTRRYWREDTRVADEAASVTVNVPESPGTATVDLDPTGEAWCYAVTWAPDGPLATEWTEYVTVPVPPAGDPLGAIPYRDLLKLTRDAAAVLTGERALTAAAALTTVQGAAETVAGSVERADAAAATAAGAIRQAADAAEQAREAVTLSQEAALSVMPMLSGSVTITPEGGTLAVDLGRAVNVVTGLAGTSGAVDVTFPDVTTPDGRVDPDGLGTLLRVDVGAERLTWPGGTVVHGTPPAGQSALASLVRVGGSVTVVWPPDVVTSAAPGVTAQIAEIEQIIGGEVEVQPGGTVMRDARPGGGVDPAVFVNPYSRPTSSELVLSVGVINQALVAGNDFTSYATHRPGGLTDYYLQAYAALGPDSEPAKDQDGWLVAVHPGPAFKDVRVTETMYDICVRVPTSRVVMFADGTWGVIFQYDAENPLFQVYMWEGYVMLSYKENDSSVPWPNGVVPTSGLRLPMQASESEYTSLGIKLPGTFHRAAELEAMGVNSG